MTSVRPRSSTEIVCEPRHRPRRFLSRRLGIAVIGQGVTTYDAPLFRNLRPHGAYFARVKPDNGLALVAECGRGAGQSASSALRPLVRRWWTAGGSQPVAYLRVVPGAGTGARSVAAQNPDGIQRPGMGPEELRTHLAQLSPADLGMDEAGRRRCSNRFQVKLLTEGSGTQIFSTTFAQWTAREALRRAQPLTLLVRFAPRQRQKPMNELLTGGPGRKRSRRGWLPGRCGYGGLLQLGQPAAAAGSGAIRISGVV